VTRPAFDPGKRFELHGKDSAGFDHLIDQAASLHVAALLKSKHSVNVKAWYVLDVLTRNKATLRKALDARQSA